MTASSSSFPATTKAVPDHFSSPSPVISPNLISKSSDKSPGPNYLVEPDPGGEEGIYIMKSAPAEKMATVDDLNQAVNNYRKAHNFGQLNIDSGLCSIATTRAEEISTDFSHNKFAEHVEKGDYNFTGFTRIGENLWQGSFSAVHIVEYGWDQSPSHRANLQSDWSRGCAGIKGENAVFIFAQ